MLSHCCSSSSDQTTVAIAMPTAFADARWPKSGSRRFPARLGTMYRLCELANEAFGRSCMKWEGLAVDRLVLTRLTLRMRREALTAATSLGSPQRGYERTREDAMAAFKRAWQG